MRDKFLFKKEIFEALFNLPQDQIINSLSVLIKYAYEDIEPSESCDPISQGILTLVKDDFDKIKNRIDKDEERRSPEYSKWRKEVFIRDEYTCQNCKMVGGELNAHHIKPFSDFPELRYDVNNGITLCKKCHKEIHRAKK